VLKYHPLGINYNFKPQNINKEVYEEDDSTSNYKKIGSSRDTRHYLYSAKATTTEREKIFVGFRTRPCRLTLGIC
jgi:hypothetical protein